MPLPDAAKADGVGAYQPTPSGAILRLRSYQADDGEHREAVEAVDDGDVTVLYDDVGLLPGQVYNNLVETFTELEELADDRTDLAALA